MLNANSSPSYELLFGDLNFREDDDARSVYSPAAYFVELLALLEGTFDGSALLARRPDLKEILLDTENTFTESPYLDIVNEVLERLVGGDPYETLRTRPHPFELPFVLRNERLKKYLHYLQVSPDELYRLFAPRVDHDIVAREFLGLSPEDADFVTAELTEDADVKACYGLAATDSLAVLQEAERFAEATGLSGEQVRELAGTGGGGVTLSVDGTRLGWVGGGAAATFSGWFEHVNRFLRLARRTGLTLTELDMVLMTCGAGRLDRAALRAVAAVVRLRRDHDLSVAEVCELIVPVELPGLDSCSGDILAARNKDYLFRLAAFIDVAESDIAGIVRRYRERYNALEPSPFDQGELDQAAAAVLRRIGRLAGALGISVDELFDVLAALEGDPSLHRYTTFAVLGEAPATRDCYQILASTDPAAGLWLIQTLFAVVTWMQATGFGGQELADILGSRPERQPEPDDSEMIAVLDGLGRGFEQVAFGPSLFRSGRFGERAAKVVYDVLTAYDDGVVSARDERLLRLDEAKVTVAAYDAVTDLGVIVAEDFLELGLDERLTAKIFTNLVLLGGLYGDGTLAAQKPAELRLASDFSTYREMLFKMIGAVVNGTAAFFPSDLATLDSLTQEQQTELYDNLRFNGYIDDAGDLRRPEFFIDPDNASQFAVNADLADVTPAVIALLEERITRVQKDPLALDVEIFADLRLTEPQLAELIESLRFNGYLDAGDVYRDKRALAALRLGDFSVPFSCYPQRGAILQAMQAQIADFQAALYTFTPGDFAEIADEAMAQRMVDTLDGTYTRDGRVLDESLFADPAGSLELGTAFTQAEQATAFRQIGVVLTDQAPYRLDPAAISELGFDDDERAQVLATLVSTGRLTESLTLPADQLAYFRSPGNAPGFAPPGLADYSMEIFFLLHGVAVEVSTAMAEIGELLAGRAKAQQEMLYSTLADAFGVPAATVAAICDAVVGGSAEALDSLVAPVLDGVSAVPAGPHLRVAYRRIRRFALLAGKLGLDAVEVSVVFRDQDLVGKFPEHLTLPPGLSRFDAVLESFDGNIYLFAADHYWIYSAATYRLTSTKGKELTELSANFGGLKGIDAAFTYPTGTEWIIGHDAGEVSRAFTRERGGTRWAPKDQTWGKIKNNFADPERIDAAFVDEDGRTYLFSGDQYIRYSSGEYDEVDEGYPRSTTEWWEREHPGGSLPPAFRASIDACFQGRDDKIHVFSGDRWLSAGADAAVSAEQPIASKWGRVRNNLANANRIDAAYAGPSAAYLFAGNQVFRYSDSIENNGVRVDEGEPRQIRDVPPEFADSVDAAFIDTANVLRLFKGGKTVELTDGARSSVVPTTEEWGKLPPALHNGTVDAAFVGLDGKTYLFSGSRYLRYSGADYSVVDLGYPRSIASDWGGLSQVDAAFVMDGKTYLFGTAGLLFELSGELLDEFATELNSGSLSPALRRRFTDHGLTPEGVTVKGMEWHVTTEEDIPLTVKKEGLRLKVYGKGARFYVRYSTRDYRTPDAGYPKPLSGNWWNLPDGLELGPIDAVFTGRDNRTYLFAGDRFIWFDVRHRWWSEPVDLHERWDSTFDRVDAAFVGQNGKTYVFSGTRFVRYSTDDYTTIDDGYPAGVATFWGNVVNNLARTGQVDAALVREVTETVDGVAVPRTYTYLFSGDQYVRYADGEYTTVQDGYPRAVAALATEPGLAGLTVPLDGVDAAFADRRTTYLFRGTQCQAVSDGVYRRYDDTELDLDLTGVSCAFLEDGRVVTGTRVTDPDATGTGVSTMRTDWTRWSALEGRTLAGTPGYQPRTLRTVPAEISAELDSVLYGADGNTYLFAGASCFNVRLNRAYPLTEEWGRPRNTIYQENAVDAAFVGRDGKTYLFSGDQYVVYPDAGTTMIEGDPRPISAHWGGLTSVTLAYVHGGKTYLFEKPDAAGTMRYLVYSGTDYSRPDEGYPALTDASFWAVPGGFPVPDAVLFEGDVMLLLSGGRCVSYNEKTGQWSAPRPVDRIWRGFGQSLDTDEGLRAAFTAGDGATYFFFADKYTQYKAGVFAAPAAIRERWGLSRNPFVPADGTGTDGTGTVDAAFVWRGEQTFLFSGDHYVRYTGPEYRYVDDGYPKKIAGNLRREEPFANLPESFEDALPGPIDAVLANDRTVYILIGGKCHAVSRTATATFEIGELGRIRNNIAERQRVDAAFVAGQYTYLFSGDQYVRYSGTEYDFADDGYPKAIDAALADELRLPPLPKAFLGGVDAAFRGPGGETFLFKGKQLLRSVAQPAEQPVKDQWGKVNNAFADGKDALDAAFVAPTGELYAFRSGHYVRYQPGRLDFVEPGYPRTVKDDWGDLPAEFEAGPDGAFVFEGRTYLTKGDRYVRYSQPRYHAVDRTFPQDFRHRWSNTADFRLTDVHTIAGFVHLARSQPDGLAAFLLTGTEDPYAYLSDRFGWAADEIRWARRNSELLTVETNEEALFEIEFLLKLAELFAVTDKLGTGPAAIYTDIWSKIWPKVIDTADRDAAADVLLALLERRTGARGWATLSAQIHRELNVLKRDALVPTVIAMRDIENSRDLFELLLIDVDMGGVGMTSRVREAIAATQMFVHRYLLDLEPAALPDGADADEIRRRLKTWWAWMKNYRLWEANRKVFLYPENYLRPELRDNKTPAFQALEDDLLQGEITADRVQQAYKRYLDEYTEVSRLAIAGGYVYTPDGTDEDTRRLVLFGRTRTEPRRYYYRSAEFRNGTRLSTSWDPWHKVDVQIDAERVDPVHAFGRVFVFWTVIEAATADVANASVVAHIDGGQQTFTAPPPAPRVKIYYSFYNLNQEWVPAQMLAADAVQNGQISDLSLYVQASRTVPGGPDGDHDSIVVTCSYKVTRAGEKGPIVEDVVSAFSLTPELYGLRATGTVVPAKAADLSKIFNEPPESPVDPNQVVRFNAPADTVDGPWLSVDHKGGSFLCRPVPGPDYPAPIRALAGNEDGLSDALDRIDAAVRLPNGTTYFFDNLARRFVEMPPAVPGAEPTRQVTAERWGVVANELNTSGVVDAVLVRDDGILLFSGPEYYRYPVDAFGTLEAGYPKKIETNDEDLPRWPRVDFAYTDRSGTEYFYNKNRNRWMTSDELEFSRSAGDWWPDLGDLKPKPPPEDVAGPSFPYDGGVISFDNDAQTYVHEVDKKKTGEPRPTRELGKVLTAITRTGSVDAGYVVGNKLYLTSGNEFVRYTLAADGSVPDAVDEEYPKALADTVKAVFYRDDHWYVFSGDDYAVMETDQELDAELDFQPILRNWRALPAEFPKRFTGTLDGASHLFFFQGDRYAAYPKREDIPRPYEIAALPNEIIRLTSSTAFELNRRLLTGGVDGLLTRETQETDELPAFSAAKSDATTVMVQPRVARAGIPISSHLDFQSSNGIYYWEIFFHAPLLIAQALNSAQRFEDARRWYDYVFDPTERTDYWRFLPFLAIDVHALVAGCRGDLLRLGSPALTDELEKKLPGVAALAPLFQQRRELTDADEATLDDLAGTGLDVVKGLLGDMTETDVVRSLRERLAMMGSLRRQYELRGDRESLLKAYLDDPFDPHAIAGLRPAAYRRAVVMAYIDNVLDWGDMLFRQYTAESIDEARMLYIFAYDLLGDRPYNLGPRALGPATSYEHLDGEEEEGEDEGEGEGEVDYVAEVTVGGALIDGPGVVHEGVARRYFYIPDNSTFYEYWTRVEDRLRKIRQSLDIMGVSRPVPLFEPPADVTALVRGVASGAALDQIAAGAAATAVSPYRFAFLHRKAQELVDRLRQFGGDLLDILERRDAEELSLLRNRQEAEILAMTRDIKEAQVRVATEHLHELQAARDSADERVRHYEQLIADGLSPVQEAQIAMMAMGAAAHFAASGLMIGAAAASGLPQIKIGPFIIGTEAGGDQVGDALGDGAEVSSTMGEGLSLLGEILGLRAEQDRAEQDWNLQLTISRSDVTQLGHQVAGAELQVQIAQRELDIVNREAAHHEAVTTFMTSKFAGLQLYNWMAGQLAGMYFQTYHLAYEVARSTERAYQFERGGGNGQVGYIQPAYWESRRNGLLAAERLGLDLERLGKAYRDADHRGLEIIKKVSLLSLDPLALLDLKNTGRCEFALTETLFDRDFPGHFRRQIKTVSVTFEGEEGPLGVYATLTQLDSKTVLAADPKAVKFLLEPKGLPPETVRADWRPTQQIALSDLEEYKENNGLFELRYDDDRYLPFEGTGAVSRWRLEAGSVSATAGLRDVTITVKYTANQGGETFATAVKGMLKPYPAARFVDVANEFPAEWAEFASNGTNELVLPFTAEMFPGISGRQVTGIYATYQVAEPTAARFLLNGDKQLALADGRLLRTPGLSVGGPGWSLVFEGDKTALTNVGLVLAYRAGAQ